MSNLFGILDIGRNALFAQQKGISVTGHNIANVNTPGFSRQKVSLETNYPLTTSPGQLGTGVDAAAIQRVYDRFLGTQIQNETMDLGKREAFLKSLQRLESVLNESTGFGLNQAMGEYWNSWQDLSSNPGGEAERVTLIAKGEALAGTFSQFRGDIVNVQKAADLSIQAAVEDINSLAEQVAGLNDKISQLEFLGQNANDYRDQRDALVNEISMSIDINSYENDDGKVVVLLNSGRPLVEDLSAWRLSTEPDGSGFHAVVWTDHGGGTHDITDRIAGGKLKGWIDARDVAAGEYLDKMDTLAGRMIEEVNTLHSAGFGLVDPATGLPHTGNDFFTGTSAADMAVSAAVSADFRTVAASETLTGVPGDNGNAINIANLQSKLTMNGTPGTTTFDEFFNATVSGIGNDVREAANFHQHQKDMVSQLENHRESVSGVSLDEEMIQLVKFQHGYEAAARLVSTVDEMMETIFAML